MSPVARRRGGGHSGRAVAVGVVGVAIALGTAFGVASLASRGDIEVRLGDDRFDAGDAEDRLERLQHDGHPILFQDPANFSRPIYLDNPTGDAVGGWIALGAVLPDAPGCIVAFDPEADAYVVSAESSDPDAGCDTGAAYPRTGEGLRTYPTEVVDGNLYVDLQDPQD